MTMIVPQESAQSLATLDLADRMSNFTARFKKLIAQSLVIPFGVIVLQVRSDRTSQ